MQLMRNQQHDVRVLQDKTSRKLKLCIINTPCSSNTLTFIQTCARALHSRCSCHPVILQYLQPRPLFITMIIITCRTASRLPSQPTRSIFGPAPGATPRALVSGAGANGSPSSHCSGMRGRGLWSVSCDCCLRVVTLALCAGATWHVMQFVHHYVYYVQVKSSCAHVSHAPHTACCRAASIGIELWLFSKVCPVPPIIQHH